MLDGEAGPYFGSMTKPLIAQYSPMAEAVFTHMLRQNGLEDQFEVDSAGTSNYHVGDRPGNNSNNKLLSDVTTEDFYRFDYLLCMDESNLASLNEIRPEGSQAIVQLFGDFDPEGERIISDPYYGSVLDFETSFQHVSRCSEAFLNHLQS
ncbi:10698_t:CDS:2 [Paraglomus occultum]|uniref:10698_t:CDS:1 n=1 Tax=Paraglomus occultum TaxID=144539 RepID=A0A9N9G450_9GLOM|nr:10698_t:CDS:2 [Paraglomus occultum]